MSRADDLARLREEMQAGQRDRTEFFTNMRRTVADLTRANQAANKERRHNVMGTLAANEGSRKRVAHEDQAARVEFVTNLKQTVAGLRKENMATNAAAHAAWCGVGTRHGVGTRVAEPAKRRGKWFAGAK